jgi:plastocyanin
LWLAPTIHTLGAGFPLAGLSLPKEGIYMQLKAAVSGLVWTFLVGLGCGSGSSNGGTAGSGGASGTGGASGAGTAGATGGTSDAGTAGATGGTSDAGTDGGTSFVAIAPCSTASSYVTGMSTIMTMANLTYSPACLKVTAGSTVVIQASAIHPLSGLTTGSPNNPIPSGGQMTPQSVTFATPGFYPFHCDVHFSFGMAGVVWVQ